MVRAPLAFLLSCSFIFAQSAPQFDAASLKPSPPPAGRALPFLRHDGGPGTGDPTRIDYRNLPLSMLLMEAYNVASADLVGPAWATSVDVLSTSDRYDIQARLPAQTTKEDLRLMLQNLLAVRFAIQVHRENKEVPAYALVVEKNGAKIKPSPPVPDGADPAEKVNVASHGEDGFPVTPPGYSGVFVRVRSGLTRVKFIRYSMEQFAKWTRTHSKRPGIDHTGLAGIYDFYLEFSNEVGTTSDSVDQAPGFTTALEKQLGLKLVPDKTTIELLVIDHINREPSGN